MAYEGDDRRDGGPDGREWGRLVATVDVMAEGLNDFKAAMWQRIDGLPAVIRDQCSTCRVNDQEDDIKDHEKRIRKVESIHLKVILSAGGASGAVTLLLTVIFKLTGI